MTVTIPPIPEPVPSRADPANFAARADATLAAWPAVTAAQNAQNVENNTIHDDVVDKYNALMAAGLPNAAANAATATTQALAATAAASTASGHASTASAQAASAAASATSAGSAATTAANTLIAAVTQRPAIKPAVSVDWTLKPTAASLVAAGWTVSRASEMTYFGQAPVKVAENLLLESRTFGSGWDKVSAPVVLTAVTHSSGLQGFNVAATAAAGLHGLKFNLSDGTYLPSQTYRKRFLVRAGAYSKVQIGDFWQGSAAARFDLATGTTLTSGGTGYVSHSITPHELGGGLYWCELVMTSSSSGEWTPGVAGYPDSATLGNGSPSYTGDGTSGVELYAAQLQQGLDSHFVETTTAAVTLYANPLLTAPAHELTYQHNNAGECMGLLSYPPTTNLCLQSANLAVSPWRITGGASGISVTQTKRLWANAAPFCRITKTDSNAPRGRAFDGPLPAAGSVYTVTLALLADYWSNTTSAHLGLTGTTNGFSGVDADSNFAVLSGPGVMTRVGNGALLAVSGLSMTVPTVMRITRTYPLAETSALTIAIYPASSASTTPGAAILATRVQLEAGARATPYIPTTTAAVTRAAQTIELAGSAFAAVNNPTQGTLLARASLEQSGLDTSRMLLGLDHSAYSLPYRTRLGATTAAAAEGLTVLANTTQASVTLPAVWGTSPATAAYSYTANSFQVAAGGVLSAVDTSGTVPPVNRLSVGGPATPAAWAGLIQRTELYPRALTAAELAAITTPGVLV